MKRPGPSSPPKPLKLKDHIHELQWRLIIVAVVFIAAAAVTFALKDSVVHIILAPLGDQELIYLNPAGAFSFIMLVSIYVGLAAAAPLFVHQVYGFLKPLLSKDLQRYSVRIFLCALLLLAAGVAFGYFYAVPGALRFLSEFADGFVTPSLTADSYLDFVVKYTLGLGLVFQVPILLVITHWIKPLTPGGLMKSQRWVIVLAFIAAAIITPTPDPINQTIIALPLIVVYQLGVIVILVSIFRKKRQLKRQQKIHAKANARAAADRSIPVPARAARQPTAALSSLDPPRQLAAPAADAQAQPAQRRFRTVDGIMVTQRPSAQSKPQLPPPRIIITDRPVGQRPGRGGLYLDGISRTLPT